jgi:hypothetical protein
MTRFRLSSHNLRIETGRNEELPRSEMSCRRCKRLLGEDFEAPIDKEEHVFVFMREYQRHKVTLSWPAHGKLKRFDAV